MKSKWSPNLVKTKFVSQTTQGTKTKTDLLSLNIFIDLLGLCDMSHYKHTISIRQDYQMASFPYSHKAGFYMAHP